MSVSDPLIKDIKGCTLRLFQEYKENTKIDDSNESLRQFCIILETIFYKGLIRNSNSFYGGGNKNWLFSIETSNFTYKNCVEQVQSCKNLQNTGKFRLLVRHCLVNKCLHVPLEALNKSKKVNFFYDKNSIIGDEILLAILLSVLMQCSRINFQLVLENYYFLDLTWELPEMVKLEVVPCKNLGISISFSDSKAVIVHIKSNSVASESEIFVGDILVKLNGIEINSSCKGRLNTILHLKNGRPIDLVIVKAFRKNSQEFFPQIKTILNNLKIDLNKIKNSSISEESEIKIEPISLTKSIKAGYKATYLGFIDVGNNGSVRQIEEAVKKRFVLSGGKEEFVVFEIGEMSVKVFNLETSEMILKHSYMQISSCGSASNLPNYVAYIAGNENCDTASNFCCYIFYVENIEEACTILQSIGQGFYRTHFAV